MLTQAVVSGLGVIVVSVLADLVEMLQVGISVEFGHFLYSGHVGFDNAGESREKE